MRIEAASWKTTYYRHYRPVKEGAVSLLPYDLLVCAILAVYVGYRGSRSWKVQLTLSIAIILFGWAASFPLMILGTSLGYDVALAEDYINDANTANGALVEVALFAAWTLLWLGPATFTAAIWRRITSADR
jgi:hypothetical protein